MSTRPTGERDRSSSGRRARPYTPIDNRGHRQRRAPTGDRTATATSRSARRPLRGFLATIRVTGYNTPAHTRSIATTRMQMSSTARPALRAAPATTTRHRPAAHRAQPDRRRPRLLHSTASRFALRDTNEKLDAYEWSRRRRSQLISTGLSPDDSSLLGVSPTASTPSSSPATCSSPRDENGSAVKIYTPAKAAASSSTRPAPCAGLRRVPRPRDPRRRRRRSTPDRLRTASVEQAKPKKCKKGSRRRRGKCVKKKKRRRTQEARSAGERAMRDVGQSLCLAAAARRPALVAAPAQASPTIESLRRRLVRQPRPAATPTSSTTSNSRSRRTGGRRRTSSSTSRGVFGNPGAISRCRAADFVLNECAPAPRSGWSPSIANYEGDPNFLLGTAPIYNMQTVSEDETARFAFVAPTVDLPVAVPVSVRSATDYGLRFKVTGIPQAMPLPSPTSPSGAARRIQPRRRSLSPGSPGTPPGCPGALDTGCLGRPMPAPGSRCDRSPTTRASAPGSRCRSRSKSPPTRTRATRRGDGRLPGDDRLRKPAIRPGLQRRADHRRGRLALGARHPAESGPVPLGLGAVAFDPANRR